MNKLSGFTMIEVIISIFIFSTGMLAFMAYHAKANSMMLDNELSRTGHALALNLVEEINSLSGEAIRDLCEENCFGTGGVGLCFDANIAHHFAGGTDASGPFNSFGKPLGGNPSENFLFYRLIRMTTYDEITNTSNPAISQLGLLRHFDIFVAWPRKEHASKKCNNVGYPECVYVRIPVVKFSALPEP